MSYTPGPLPEPTQTMGKAGGTFVPLLTGPLFTASQMQTYTAAEVARAVAAERERWTELVQSLVACHEEPSCPAVEWARDVIRNGWDSVPAEEFNQD